MTAKSTKGLQVHINKGTATPVTVIPTAITKAKPAQVTVASTTGMLTGEIVTMVDTGFVELDTRSFIIGAVASTTFTLLGTNTTASTGVLASTPKANYYKPADMVLLCLSALTPNVSEPGTVSTATFCDATTSIPSAVIEAGTLTMSGYVDITQPDYQELLAAQEDLILRAVRVTIPSNGYLVAPITMSTITWDLPIDGASAYTATAVMGRAMKHVY